MNTIRLKFKNKEGKDLSARLELPVDGKPSAFALFAHCFTCDKNFHAATHISRALAINKIGVLRFDFTGLGDSEGEFSDTNLSSNVSDLISAAAFLEEHYMAPQLLIGHSLGGTAVLLATQEIESAKAVVTIGSPADPEHVMQHFQGSLEEIKEKGSARVSLGRQSFVVKQQFVEDVAKSDMQAVLQKLNKALLVLHAPQDTVVDIENATHIYAKSRHSKSFISLDQMDHFLSQKKDGVYVGNLIASWVERYIEFIEPELLITDKQVVTRTGENTYTTEIRAGKHTLVADEPLSVGGSDLGPDPYALLNASLGACTGMTLHMYASRKGWDLQEVKVHLSHDKAYAEDCAACPEKDAKMDHIKRSIEISGSLTEDQRKRLLEIANKCPVHKTLSSDIHIASSLL